MTKVAVYCQYEDKDKVVEHYAPLVKKIALHLLVKLPDSVLLDDLMQAGMIGLLEASSKFDVSHGVKFETFAGIRIRGAMIDETRKGDWVPRSVHRHHREILAATAELESELGSPPSSFEVAKRLNLDIDKYHEIVSDISSGRMIGAEEVLASYEMAKSDDSPAQDVEANHFKQALAKAIASLPDKEAKILSLYYDEGLNLKEIGLVFDVSESRISQILSQATVRLQSKMSNWQ